MRWRRWHWLGLLPLALVPGVVALDRCYPPDLSRARLLSPELSDATGQVLNLRPAADGMIRLAPTGDMGWPAPGPADGELARPGLAEGTARQEPEPANGDLVRLLLAREDRRFHQHPGVDPLALLRAAGQLLRHGRVVSGGSTLAMQVARLLEPHPRTVWGKLHDIARALQLQAHLGREGVLRLYLTLAPMGGNIEGVRAASLLYFGREPAALDLTQAALLVGLPQSPTRRRPDRFPAAAWHAARQVLASAGETGTLTETAIPRAPLPGLARHLAQRLNGRSVTTLDGGMQRAVEALIARELPWLGPDADAAVVVVRNRDRAILAYAGGGRFFEPGGMVDMVRATRSPGSALKPVIYAMAFDAGLAAPGTWLDDAPMRLGTYAPRNFDRVAYGRVTAAMALRQSLNRPAVRLLAEIGPARFAAALAGAGASLTLPRGASPSAALALGGAGSTLLGLATLYADLADDGARGIPYLTGAPPAATGRLVSRSAAREVAAILRDQPTPPGVTADPARPIAFKTGTSYGFRDAWACGFTPGHTVAVWVGRRDGSPRPGAAGRQAAAPLLFRIFGLLPPEPAGIMPGRRASDPSAATHPPRADRRSASDPLQPAHASPTADTPSDPSAAPGPAIAEQTSASPASAGRPRAPLAPALRGLAQTRLRILFPPDRVDLSFTPDAPIGLEAAGGTPPYTWIADNAVLAAPSIDSRPVLRPGGPGWVHLTVMDAAGQSASTDVRLVPE